MPLIASYFLMCTVPLFVQMCILLALDVVSYDAKQQLTRSSVSLSLSYCFVLSPTALICILTTRHIAKTMHSLPRYPPYIYRIIIYQLYVCTCMLGSDVCYMLPSTRSGLPFSLKLPAVAALLLLSRGELDPPLAGSRGSSLGNMRTDRSQPV